MVRDRRQKVVNSQHVQYNVVCCVWNQVSGLKR